MPNRNDLPGRTEKVRWVPGVLDSVVIGLFLVGLYFGAVTLWNINF